MKPLSHPSPPPCDARVACADVDAIQPTNKACPEPTSKLDDSGRGGFSPDIESEWLRYIAYQESRLLAAGDQYPNAYLSPCAGGYASGLLTPSGQESRGETLDEAVGKRVELLSKYGPDLVKREKIAKLEAELASLKGEGAGA